VVYPRTDISASPQAVASSELVKERPCLRDWHAGILKRLALQEIQTQPSGLTTGPGIRSKGYAEPSDSP